MKRISYLAVPLVITMLSATATRAQDLGAQIQAANDHLINQGHVSMVLDFFAPQFVVHLSTGDVQGDPEFITEFVNGLRTAFPDLHVEVQILVVQGNRVAWLRRNRRKFRRSYGRRDQEKNNHWRLLARQNRCFLSIRMVVS